jgi:hypothetical protein
MPLKDKRRRKIRWQVIFWTIAAVAAALMIWSPRPRPFAEVAHELH